MLEEYRLFLGRAPLAAARRRRALFWFLLAALGAYSVFRLACQPRSEHAMDPLYGAVSAAPWLWGLQWAALLLLVQVYTPASSGLAGLWGPGHALRVMNQRLNLLRLYGLSTFTLGATLGILAWHGIAVHRLVLTAVQICLALALMRRVVWWIKSWLRLHPLIYMFIACMALLMGGAILSDSAQYVGAVGFLPFDWDHQASLPVAIACLTTLAALLVGSQVFVHTGCTQHLPRVERWSFIFAIAAFVACVVGNSLYEAATEPGTSAVTGPELLLGCFVIPFGAIGGFWLMWKLSERLGRRLTQQRPFANSAERLLWRERRGLLASLTILGAAISLIAVVAGRVWDLGHAWPWWFGLAATGFLLMLLALDQVKENQRELALLRGQGATFPVAWIDQQRARGAVAKRVFMLGCMFALALALTPGGVRSLMLAATLMMTAAALAVTIRVGTANWQLYVPGSAATMWLSMILFPVAMFVIEEVAFLKHATAAVAALMVEPHRDDTPLFMWGMYLWMSCVALLLSGVAYLRTRAEPDDRRADEEYREVALQRKG